MTPRESIAGGFAINCNLPWMVWGMCDCIERDKLVRLASVIRVSWVYDIAKAVINTRMASPCTYVLNSDCAKGISGNAPSLFDAPPAIACRCLKSINA